jgi:hypothetical protein
VDVTRLSEHFTLDELCHSQTASRLCISNTPSPLIVEALKVTAQGLERVRALCASPIVVSSGYRSRPVNDAVGGSSTSQHMSGQAADITAPGYGTVEELMHLIYSHRDAVGYDQLLQEFVREGIPDSGWVHISFSDKPRQQALVIDHTGTRVYQA